MLWEYLYMEVVLHDINSEPPPPQPFTPLIPLPCQQMFHTWFDFPTPPLPPQTKKSLWNTDEYSKSPAQNEFCKG